MSRGFVASVDGIVQEYGDTGRLWPFYNGVTDFSPALTGPLPRLAVVTFDIVPHPSGIGIMIVNVAPTGETDHGAPILNQTSDRF